MPEPERESELFPVAAKGAPPALKLLITLDQPSECIWLEWTERQTSIHVASVRIGYEPSALGLYEGRLRLEHEGGAENDSFTHHAASIHAQLNRLKKRFPVEEADISACAVRS